MRKLTWMVAAVFFCSAFLSSPGLYADEPVATAKDLEKINKDLMDHIKDLQSTVKDLNGRLSAQEKKGAAPAPTYVPAASGPTQGGVMKTLEDINFSGFLDTSYNFNLNRPAKAGTNANTNRMRIFDIRDNQFNLDALELDFEKLAPKEGGIGFRADLQYGLNSLVTDGAGLNFDGSTDPAAVGVGPDEFDLQQAYGEINIPINGGNAFGDVINLKAGKFVTLAGAEVIESKDNWNISRSVAFGFGIPFTHTGVRGSVDLAGGKAKLLLGVNNGWDLVQDTGNGKTFESGLTLNLTDDLTFVNANYIGPESLADAGTGGIIDDVRFLTSNVVTWKTPVKKLTLMGEVIFGNQRNTVAITAGAPHPDRFQSAQWHSYNLYAKYDISDKMYFAYRGELFRDDDVFRTFGTTTPNELNRIWSHTFTLDYRFYTNLITRFEYRHDFAEAGIFDQSTAGSASESSQGTFGTELIYLF